MIEIERLILRPFIMEDASDVFSLAEIGGVSGNNGIVGTCEEVFIPAIDFFIF